MNQVLASYLLQTQQGKTGGGALAASGQPPLAAAGLYALDTAAFTHLTKARPEERVQTADKQPVCTANGETVTLGTVNRSVEALGDEQLTFQALSDTPDLLMCGRIMR